MYNRKIKVLHIIKDDKFFDGVINAFESDERLENRCVLLVKSPSYEFFRITQKEKVKLLWSDKMLRECLQSPDYDVIFFHSLNTDKYKYFKYIPQDKIVIWWCWGMELYSQTYGMSQLMPTALYKPQTKQIVDRIKHHGIKRQVKDLVRDIFWRPYYEHLRMKVIARIDYFQPVIPLEYQLMQKVKGFRAKEFYYPRCFTNVQSNSEHILPADGDILLGNSTSPNNNHLDVWETIQPYLGEHRTVVMPLNYKSDKAYADMIADIITSDKHQIEKLRTFMPQEEYFKLIDNCSYAVFGVMRQQAMGNIYHCLRQGIKVFLYRDSLVYKDLKALGYVVYAIEDIDENSFSTPLKLKELEMNAKALENQRDYVENVRENAFNELINICKKKDWK